MPEHTIPILSRIPQPMIVRPTPQPMITHPTLAELARIQPIKLELVNQVVWEGEPILALMYVFNPGPDQVRYRMELKVNGNPELVRELDLVPGQNIVVFKLKMPPGNHSLELNGIQTWIKVIPRSILVGMERFELDLAPNSVHELKISNPWISRVISRIKLYSWDAVQGSVQLELLNNSGFQDELDPRLIKYAFFKIDAPPMLHGWIEFKVENSWLRLHELAPEDVRLYKRLPPWIEIDTSILHQDLGFSYYLAELDSFSEFGILGVRKPAPQPQLLSLLVVVGIGISVGLIALQLTKIVSRPGNLELLNRNLDLILLKLIQRAPSSKLQLSHEIKAKFKFSPDQYKLGLILKVLESKGLIRPSMNSNGELVYGVSDQARAEKIIVEILKCRPELKRILDRAQLAT